MISAYNATQILYIKKFKKLRMLCEKHVNIIVFVFEG